MYRASLDLQFDYGPLIPTELGVIFVNVLAEVRPLAAANAAADVSSISVGDHS
jgi:hypothetical protein